MKLSGNIITLWGWFTKGKSTLHFQVHLQSLSTISKLGATNFLMPQGTILASLVPERFYDPSQRIVALIFHQHLITQFFCCVNNSFRFWGISYAVPDLKGAKGTIAPGPPAIWGPWPQTSFVKKKKIYIKLVLLLIKLTKYVWVFGYRTVKPDLRSNLGQAWP